MMAENVTMEEAEAGECMDEGCDGEEGVANAWGQWSFAEVMRNGLVVRKLYLGEDGVNDLGDFEDLCESLVEEDGGEGGKPRSPVVFISPEKYHNLFQPWRGALILKLLGKSVNLRIMEQTTRGLWKLE